MPSPTDNTAEIDTPSGARGGMPVFWRSAPTEGPAAPALYLHGVPTNSDDWISPRERHATRSWWRRWWRAKRPSDQWVEPPPYGPGFLERTGGLAPDLPGFGRSGKPGYLKYTIEEYSAFIERFLDMVEVEKVRMLVHDWGAVGLAFAQAHPERIERLVVTNAVTFLPGYDWHRTARAWRTPGLGELVMGATARPILRFTSREGNFKPGPMPETWLDTVLDHFDQGTQRAILRLYRSSPSEVLAKAGERLSLLTMPSLVVWGMADPYIPPHFAAEYAKALPNSELLELPDAGHWWWFDRPDAIDRVAEFLLAS